MATVATAVATVAATDNSRMESEPRGRVDPDGWAPDDAASRRVLVLHGGSISGKAYSSRGWARCFLAVDRCAFSVNRRTFEPRVGRLGRRRFGTTLARATSSSSRARASARLASCVRCSRATMISTPSCVSRFPASANRRVRTSCEREGE